MKRSIKKEKWIEGGRKLWQKEGALFSVFAWKWCWRLRGGNGAGDLRVTRTKDSSGRHGFLIYPERHLRKDYSHDAGDVRLDHEVAHFPLQVEVDRHYHIFTWKSRERETGSALLPQKRTRKGTRSEWQSVKTADLFWLNSYVFWLLSYAGRFILF